MADTIFITGANGSLANPTVDYLLTHAPTSKLVLTVRDASDNDTNTKTLREVIAKHPKADTSIRELDLGHLAAVHGFARKIEGEITAGSLPKLSSIVATAYYWNLSGPVQMTDDGYEKTFQVTYLSHVALVLRLLGSFRPEGGRIVLFTSDGHEPGKNALERIPPCIPTDSAKLELLVKPGNDNPSIDALGHGFHRYANAKLATVMFTHALNRRLKSSEKLKNITVVVTNPGNLADSRALRVNTPRKLVFLSTFVIRPLQPLLSLMDPTARTVSQAAADVARLATDDAHPGERGYYTLLTPYEGSQDSQDEKTQEVLWGKSLQWASIKAQDTAVGI